MVLVAQFGAKASLRTAAKRGEDAIDRSVDYDISSEDSGKPSSDKNSS